MVSMYIFKAFSFAIHSWEALEAELNELIHGDSDSDTVVMLQKVWKLVWSINIVVS